MTWIFRRVPRNSDAFTPSPSDIRGTAELRSHFCGPFPQWLLVSSKGIPSGFLSPGALSCLYLPQAHKSGHTHTEVPSFQLLQFMNSLENDLQGFTVEPGPLL